MTNTIISFVAGMLVTPIVYIIATWKTQVSEFKQGIQDAHDDRVTSKNIVKNQLLDLADDSVAAVQSVIEESRLEQVGHNAEIDVIVILCRRGPPEDVCHMVLSSKLPPESTKNILLHLSEDVSVVQGVEN